MESEESRRLLKLDSTESSSPHLRKNDGDIGPESEAAQTKPEAQPEAQPRTQKPSPEPEAQSSPSLKPNPEPEAQPSLAQTLGPKILESMSTNPEVIISTDPDADPDAIQHNLNSRFD